MFRATVSSDKEELTWTKSARPSGRTISPLGWPSPLNVPSPGRLLKERWHEKGPPQLKRGYDDRDDVS